MQAINLSAARRIFGAILFTAAGAGAATAPQGWNGTLTVRRAASANYDASTGAGQESHQDTLNEEIKFTVTNGKAVAAIVSELKEHVLTRLDYETALTVITVDRTTVANGIAPASSGVDIQINADGRYELSYGAGGVSGTLSETSTEVITCKVPPPDCNSGSRTNTLSDPASNVSGASGSAAGRTARDQLNTLVGSKRETFDFRNGLRGTQTVTWNLQR